MTNSVCNGDYDTLHSLGTSFLRVEHLDVANENRQWPYAGSGFATYYLVGMEEQIDRLWPHFLPDWDMVFLGTQFSTPSCGLRV